MSVTTAPEAARIPHGVLRPRSGVWEIDPGHADVAFTGRHLMFTKVRGHFTDVRGAVIVGEEMNDSQVDVVIAMASVHSGNDIRDDHLRSTELFDVGQFPKRPSAASAWTGPATVGWCWATSPSMASPGASHSRWSSRARSATPGAATAPSSRPRHG